jgi:hypothetical protein
MNKLIMIIRLVSVVSIVFSILFPSIRIGVFFAILVFEIVKLVKVNRIGRIMKETETSLPSNELIVHEFFQYFALFFVEFLRLMEYHKILSIFIYSYLLLAFLWLLPAFFHRIKSFLYTTDDEKFYMFSQVIFYKFDLSIVSLINSLFFSALFVFLLYIISKSVLNLRYIGFPLFFLVLISLFYLLNLVLLKLHKIKENDIKIEMQKTKGHIISKVMDALVVYGTLCLIIWFINKFITFNKIISVYVSGKFLFSLEYFIGIFLFILIPFYTPKQITRIYFSKNIL